jgi:ABC-type multidrug transport system ATPase subunit
VIEARSLTKRYDGDLPALDDLDLRVNPGEVYGLVGGAGAGKTTAFRLFMSAITPTRGQALVGGTDSAADPITVKRSASFISRHHAPFATVSARKNVDFFVRVGDPKRTPNRTEVENAMRRVGVPERCFNRRCDELTADVLVLLWLAVARLRDSAALFLDDPSTNLSAHGVAELQDSLLDFRSSGRAVLITTSDVAFVTRIADRIGILQSGRKVVERTQAELLGQSLTQFYLDYEGRALEGQTPAPSA